MKATEDAMAAEAAASLLKTEKEREAKLIADGCRDLLKFVSPDAPQDDHDEIVAKYMESHRSRVGGRAMKCRQCEVS